MRAGDVEIARVARDAGAHAHAELLQERLHHPELAGEVELAENIDVHRTDVVRLVRADDVIEQRFARKLVAEVLGADEARGVNGHDRRAEALGGAEADGVEIVADERGHAGRINEDGWGAMLFDDLADGLEELLLALAHDHVEFGEVGGEAHAPEARAGRRRAAVVPGIAFAGERPMDEMGDVRHRLQHDFRAVEGAAARRRARRQRFRAALLARVGVLGLVLFAGRLLEKGLDARLARHGLPSGKSGSGAGPFVAALHKVSVRTPVFRQAMERVYKARRPSGLSRQIERVVGLAGDDGVGVELVEHLVEERRQNP